MKTLVTLLAAAILGVGCRNVALPTIDPSMGEIVPARERTSEASSEPCPSEAKYSDRWTNFALGGPTLGPITLAVGDQTEQKVSGLLTPNGDWILKLLLLVDAPTGTSITGVATQTNGSGIGRFTHFSTNLSEVGQPTYEQGLDRLEGSIRSHGNPDNAPKDLPGYLVVRNAGCYELTFSLDGMSYGPFGVRLG